MADLGGGSLELAELSEDGMGRTISLPLGVLKLEAWGLKGAKQALRQTFEACPGNQIWARIAVFTWWAAPGEP